MTKKTQETKPGQKAPEFPWKLLILGGFGLAVLFIFFVALVSALFSNSAGSSVPGFKPSNIAVIPLHGEIFSGRDEYDGALSSEELGDLIDKANDDPSVGAILFDIDSPGGEVVATKQVVYKIRESEKPVYAYINSMGASGGYYIAAATDYIMADEDSITGSIGVISIFPNFNELLEKVGVKFNVIKEGEYKDIMSPFKDPTEKEKEMLQAILDETYQKFRSDVLFYRQDRMTAAELDSVADGRIISGRQAYAARLVDELVQKNHALKRAGELAGIESPNPIYYGEQRFSFADMLFSSGKAFGSGLMASMQSGQGMQFR